MKRAWFVVRSAFLWAVSLLHFAIAVPSLIALAIFLDPKKHDWLQRTFCRRIIFFAGQKLKLFARPASIRKKPVSSFRITSTSSILSRSIARFRSSSAAGNSNPTSISLSMVG